MIQARHVCINLEANDQATLLMNVVELLLKLTSSHVIFLGLYSTAHCFSTAVILKPFCGKLAQMGTHRVREY